MCNKDKIDDCLLRVKIDQYDLVGLINKIREVYNSEFLGEYNPGLFYRETNGEVSIDINIYGKNERLDTNTMLNFMDIKDAIIYMDFAVDNIYGVIELGDGTKIGQETMDTGYMKFTEDSSYGFTIEKYGVEYIFEEVEYIACSGNSETKINPLRHGKDLRKSLLNFLNKFYKNCVD